MILVSEILKRLPCATSCWCEHGPDYRFRMYEALEDSLFIVSRERPINAETKRVLEFRLVELVRFGEIVYDWEMLV